MSWEKSWRSVIYIKCYIKLYSEFFKRNRKYDIECRIVSPV